MYEAPFTQKQCFQLVHDGIAVGSGFRLTIEKACITWLPTPGVKRCGNWRSNELFVFRCALHGLRDKPSQQEFFYFTIILSGKKPCVIVLSVCNRIHGRGFSFPTAACAAPVFGKKKNKILTGQLAEKTLKPLQVGQKSIKREPTTAPSAFPEARIQHFRLCMHETRLVCVRSWCAASRTSTRP